MKVRVLIFIPVWIALAAAFYWYHETIIERWPMTKVGVDFIEIFRPAALVFLRGGNPYAVHGFYSPFWILIPIIPFALLPAPVGYSLFTAANFMLYFIVARRMGVNLFGLILIMYAFELMSAILGNTEGLFLLGMILPPQIGLLFLMSKPQAGVIVALVMAWVEFSERGMKGVLRMFGPLAIVSALSVALYGFWFLKMGEVIHAVWNMSMWPWSLLIGAPILIMALVRKDKRLGLAASPFFSPYVSLWTYGGFFVGGLSACKRRAAVVEGM